MRAGGGMKRRASFGRGDYGVGPLEQHRAASARGGLAGGVELGIGWPRGIDEGVGEIGEEGAEFTRMRGDHTALVQLGEQRLWVIAKSGERVGIENGGAFAPKRGGHHLLRAGLPQPGAEAERVETGIGQHPAQAVAIG